MFRATQNLLRKVTEPKLAAFDESNAALLKAALFLPHSNQGGPQECHGTNVHQVIILCTKQAAPVLELLLKCWQCTKPARSARQVLLEFCQMTDPSKLLIGL
jgi:hypothetical protein